MIESTIKFFLTIGVALIMWAYTLLPHVQITDEAMQSCKMEGGYSLECIQEETRMAKLVNKKIKDVCKDNPESSCEDIDSYCREALEQGQECYFFNFK